MTCAQGVESFLGTLHQGEWFNENVLVGDMVRQISVETGTRARCFRRAGVGWITLLRAPSRFRPVRVRVASY
jgi:hypothetical protein